MNANFTNNQTGGYPGGQQGYSYDPNTGQPLAQQTYSQLPGQPSIQPQQAPQPNGGPSKSGVAIAALVLGIVGIATSFVPIVNNISFFIGLVGVVLAIVGFVGISKGKKSGKGFAVAGLVLNILTLVIVLASQAFYGSVIDSVTSNMNTSTSSSSTATSSNASSSAVTANSVANTGTSGSSNGVTVNGKYESTITGVTFASDYRNRKTIVVDFTFTNNDDEDAVFGTDVRIQAYQNGVELNTDYTSDETTNDALKHIKPGATITVKDAFILDDSSPVTIEIFENHYFGDNVILATDTFDVQ